MGHSGDDVTSSRAATIDPKVFPDREIRGFEPLLGTMVSTVKTTASVLLVHDDPEVGPTLSGLLAEGLGGCDLVTAAAAARERFACGGYQLLVSRESLDGFELLSEARCDNALFPGILLSSEPSVESALRAMRLQVTAYLTEPLDTEELLRSAKRALERFRASRAVHDLRERVEAWGRGLGALETSMEPGPGPDASPERETLVQNTIGNIMGVLLDVAPLCPQERVAPGQSGALSASGLTAPEYRAALREAIEVLERTKHSFKSRELGQLRKRLQGCLNGEIPQAMNTSRRKTHRV